VPCLPPCLLPRRVCVGAGGGGGAGLGQLCAADWARAACVAQVAISTTDVYKTAEQIKAAGGKVGGCGLRWLRAGA